MPIETIKKGDLNELAWLLKEAYNIMKQQDLHNVKSGLFKSKTVFAGVIRTPATMHDAMNAIMSTIAHTQAERSRVA